VHAHDINRILIACATFMMTSPASSSCLSRPVRQKWVRTLL
jgi:hypothetical protein